MTDDPAILHASAVALAGRGVLIRGASGSGKSALALTLIATGAVLIADDRTVLRRDGDTVRLSAPEPIRGMIEARGVGLLRAEAVMDVALALVVDLDTVEPDRLPPARRTRILGCDVPLVHDSGFGSFPAAVRQYLLSGRLA